MWSNEDAQACKNPSRENSMWPQHLEIIVSTYDISKDTVQVKIELYDKETSRLSILLERWSIADP